MRITDFAAIVCVASVAATLSSNAGAEPSDLDKANARKLFNEGLDLRKAGDHKGALEKLEAADAVFATPKGRLELARERMFNNKLVEAYTAYLSVANVPVAPKDEAKYTAHRAEAAKLASELEPRIPTVKVTVEGVPAGQTATVQIDGAIVPDAALAEPRMVNPGKHVVTARVEGAPIATSEIQLKEGEKRSVVLTIVVPPKGVVGAEAASPNAQPTSFESKPPPAKEQPKDVAPASEGTQKYVAIGVGGLGVVSLAVGTVFGLNARSKANDASPHCQSSTVCSSQFWADQRNDALHKANVSTIGFIAGGVLVGAGVVLWFTAPSATSKQDTALVVGPGSIGLRGHF